MCKFQVGIFVSGLTCKKLFLVKKFNYVARIYLYDYFKVACVLFLLTGLLSEPKKSVSCVAAKLMRAERIKSRNNVS